MATIVKFYKDGRNVKDITSIGYLPVDLNARKDSKHLLASGAVATISSNFAPDYTKKTYEANSYVMNGGVLYTNENAIGTAEDWNPAHWTQTTVAEMMASAGGSSYIETSQTVILNSNQSLDIGEREVKYLQVTAQNSNKNLTLKCSNDCVIRINSDGQDFNLILKDSAGTSLDTVIRYTDSLSKEYATVDDTDVIQDVYLENDTSLSAKKGYIRVTGHIALVIWADAF